ncbi:MAG TPA: hypothetical protein PK970_10110 [Hyphomicrobiaceae bacterium]|nr:hypothetical protein [Hyphomicrobiaceae bacterium]
MLWWVVASTSAVLIAAGVWLIAKDFRPTGPRPVTWRGLVAQRRSLGEFAARLRGMANAVSKTGTVDAPKVSVRSQGPAVARVEIEAVTTVNAGLVDNVAGMAPTPAPPIASDSPATADPLSTPTFPLRGNVVRQPFPQSRGRASALDHLVELIDEQRSVGLEQRVHFDREPSLEARWRQIAPLAEAIVFELNARTASEAFEIASAGDAGWSAGNLGYGHYRRLKVGGVSVAWLRIEVRRHDHVALLVRAHAPEHAAMNALSLLDAWPVSEDALQRGLVDAVRGAALFAAARQNAGQARSTAAQSIPPEQGADLIEAAVILVNGAFGDIGARLVPLQGGTGTDGLSGRAYRIEFRSRPAGLLVANERDGQIELSVGVRDPTLIRAAQRATLVRGRTGVYELAEAMASCVWPTLALEGADKIVQ